MRRRSLLLLLALLGVHPAVARADAVGFVEEIRTARETLRFDSSVVSDPRGVWRIEGLSGEIPVSSAWGRVHADRIALLGATVARDARGEATIRGGVLSIRGIEADALGGRIEAGVALDARRADREDLRTAFLLRVTRIDLARLAFLLPPDLSATGRLSGEIEVQAVAGVPMRATGRLFSVGGGEIRVPERLRRRARELPATIRYRTLAITLFESDGVPRARVEVVPEGNRSLVELLRGSGPQRGFDSRRYVFDLPLAPLFQ